ncbi:zinc transporter 1 [Elysia marginata]|uniref:Zinc transporter 1 n=1 Tax=Elysia marginata TaxID=1093978 RepID=A0AAV4F601_9GAST|nr:zinc transporter 1 [Elysia marginata]
MGRYTGKTCRLFTMMMLTGSFFLAEIIVGYVTNSIALIADSFHMLSDVIALIVAFASVRISKWPSKRNTYGWVRAEVLGALVNAVFLVALCFSILVEAIKRIVVPEVVDDPKLLLGVGIAGLLVNVLGLIIFGNHGHSHGGGHGHSHGGGHGHLHKAKGHSHEGHGHSHGEAPKHSDKRAGDGQFKVMANGHGACATESEKLVTSHDFHGTSDGMEANKTVLTVNSNHEVYTAPGTDIIIDFEKKPEIASASQLNMRGVFIHVLGDALGSVIVVVSALVVIFSTGEWRFYFDPAASILMVVIILFTALPLLKESAFILLQTVPSHVNVENIIRDLEQMEGIYGVHECHIWQLAGNRIVASAHIRCRGIEEYMELASRIKQLFHNAGIHSTTIQPEFIDWQDALGPEKACALVCPPTEGDSCAPNTCCGTQELRPRKNQNLVGDSVEANQNNSNNADDSADDAPDGVERPVVTVTDMSSHRNQPPAAMFTSAHSLDVKFSPDGDEVVLEMSDIMGRAGSGELNQAK